ncbi:unnamed protein product [Didymodactylos carnosus]|uniref:Uncharacterized protein n=1 Tax=Didymodactylos carnosus TaxID=1234261 RepID=A0A814H7Y3_9BILA|nr:unnamed protein product [Didymodactylos carnosus]CAF1007118.1 unnamed protein product [Didymodactylos carnosus]CAF3541323.1 unnamed protein product [Didymodactylos carnosus]CAF3778332.1 unnamed protein product [Didymodactylos carnosus]
MLRNISSMATNNLSSSVDNEQELLNDPPKLHSYVLKKFDDFNETMTDDEIFCQKDIEATAEKAQSHINCLIKKFSSDLSVIKEELDKRLKTLQEENKSACEENMRLCEEKFHIFEELFSQKKYEELYKKCKEFEVNFEYRLTTIQNVPKLHLKDIKASDYFSFGLTQQVQSQSLPESTSVPDTKALYRVDSNDDDKSDDNVQQPLLTNKQRMREQKAVESVIVDEITNGMEDEKDSDDHETDSKNNNGTSLPYLSLDEKSAISKANDVQTEQYQGTTTTWAFYDQNNNRRNISSRGRQQQHNRGRVKMNSPANNCSTTTILSPNPNISRQRIDMSRLTLRIPYEHPRDHSTLITCNKNYIVLFTRRNQRTNDWSLKSLDVQNNYIHNLKWNDGIILALGRIDEDFFYIFTELRFFIYNVHKEYIVDQRILTKSNVDEHDEITAESNYTARIGCFANNYMYYIFKNKSQHYLLVRCLASTLMVDGKFDLTQRYPEVIYFLYICVEKTLIAFLSLNNEKKYSVLFADHEMKKRNEIELIDAIEPLTISTACIKIFTKDETLWLINDPKACLIHCINNQVYLFIISSACYSICTFGSDLVIATNKDILALNLNEHYEKLKNIQR